MTRGVAFPHLWRDVQYDFVRDAAVGPLRHQQKRFGRRSAVQPVEIFSAVSPEWLRHVFPTNKIVIVVRGFATAGDIADVGRNEDFDVGGHDLLRVSEEASKIGIGCGVGFCPLGHIAIAGLAPRPFLWLGCRRDTSAYSRYAERLRYGKDFGNSTEVPLVLLGARGDGHLCASVSTGIAAMASFQRFRSSARNRFCHRLQAYATPPHRTVITAPYVKPNVFRA